MYRIYNTQTKLFWGRGHWSKVGRLFARKCDMTNSLKTQNYRGVKENQYAKDFLPNILVIHYQELDAAEKTPIGEFYAQKPRERKYFRVPFYGKIMGWRIQCGKDFSWISGDQPFDRTMTIVTTENFASGGGARFKDELGYEYDMLPGAFRIVAPQMIRGEIKGTWRFVKRGAAYGIELIATGDRVITNRGHNWA